MHGDRLFVGAPRGQGAAWLFAAPWNGPQVSALWSGTQARGAFGRSFLPSDQRCWVSEPGEGSVSDDDAPQGRIWNLDLPVHALARFPSSPAGRSAGMRWVGWRAADGRGLRPQGSGTCAGELVAWGLVPGERASVNWARADPLLAVQAVVDSKGELRIDTGGAPPGSPILELSREGERTWRLDLGL